MDQHGISLERRATSDALLNEEIVVKRALSVVDLG